MPSLIKPLQVTCPQVLIGAKSYSLTLPGGATISGQTPDLFPNPDEICANLLAQMQVAISPTLPIFDLVGAVLCIKDVLDGVKSLPDPSDMIKALNACVVKFEDLAKLIPQISAPIMIANTLDLLICVLDGVVTKLQEIIIKQLAIQALAAKANGPTSPILQLVECAGHINSTRICAVNESLGPLQAIIDLINILLELVGLDPIPPLGEMASDLSEAIAQFRVIITTLKQVRGLLGIPLIPVVPRCDGAPSISLSIPGLAPVTIV